MRINNIFKKITWMAVFFPFVSPYPLNTDVQPIAFIFIVLLFLGGAIKYKFNAMHAAMLIFSSLSIFYVNLDVEYSVVKRFGFFAALIALIYADSEGENLDCNLIKFILYFHVTIILFQLFYPDYFSALFGHFIRNSTYVMGDIRGVHGLNAEPGGASAVLVTIYFFLMEKLRKIDRKNLDATIILGVAVIGLIVTWSGLAIICIFFALFYHFLVFKNDRLIIIFCVMASLFVLFSYDSGQTRGIALLMSVWDLGIELLFLDGSIAERLLGLSYGVLSLTINPFGFGGGGYPVGARVVENQYELSVLFASARDQIEASISMAGVYFVEFGIIYLLFLIFILFYYRPKTIESVPIFILAVAFFVFSFSVAFPMTWILFYTVKKHNLVLRSFS